MEADNKNVEPDKQYIDTCFDISRAISSAIPVPACNTQEKRSKNPVKKKRKKKERA
jgi:hypothetical protein